jgi:predicted dehydrogenase
MSHSKLRYGMVGGGQGAFIGAVHRKAMALDGQFALVAGALSSTPEKSRASGLELGLADSRNYGRWQEMLAGELLLPADERIELVVIVTPNDVHFTVAQAFATAGIHVVCDKPLVHNSQQANELIKTVEQSAVVFAVTHNYTGYPLVRQARQMVRDGVIGEVRKIIVEYNQGWLATKLEDSGQKQAAWRADPARSGLAGAMGDIGSHAENLAATITGLEPEAICADLTSFVPGRLLDDDASLLLRYSNGARGVLITSQIAIGGENDLRIRVFGSLGSLAWQQEQPNSLHLDLLDGTRSTLTRGSALLGAAAQRATRLPSGHPEGFIEAFANLYLGVAEAIRAKTTGLALGELEGDFPTIYDGARGVHFIEKTLESAASAQKWTQVRWQKPG